MNKITNNSFVDAFFAKPEYGFTANGAKTFKSSTDKCVDLFFLIGAVRSRPDAALTAFQSAFAEEPELACRILLWGRDCRGGAGERNTVRYVIQNMLTVVAFQKYVPSLIIKLIEVGRWDDLFIFFGTRFESFMLDGIAYGLLVAQDGLCAKWMPRKGKEAVAIRTHLQMTPKQYRKHLVNMTSVVESQMCAKNWDAINYSHVPSLAAARYQKAFRRHDPARYGEWADIVSGVAKSDDPTVKVNAATVYPYDVLKSLFKGDVQVACAQWDAMPNWLGDNGFILPICDVSGSMMTPVASGISALDISVSLGLYLADKQKGPFSGMVMTFSDKSELVKLNGNLQQKMSQIKTMDWGGSTNVQSAFTTILNHALRHKVPQKDMPRYLLIISDMEFNSCGSITNFDAMKRQYAVAGYELPNVVFWNVHGRIGNSPALSSDKRVALVSGFSPAIMQSVLSSKTVTPRDIMLKAVMNDRYGVMESHYII